MTRLFSTHLFGPSRRSWTYRLLSTVVVLAIATALILSNYITGNWAWATPPKVPHQGQLNAVKEEGIVLEHWQTIEQYAGEISGYDWSIQALVPDNEIPIDSALALQPENPIILLLRPQTWHRDMPQVEWMDISGIQKWTTDQKRRVTLTVPATRSADAANRDDDESVDEPERSDARDVQMNQRPITVRARFFRGWTRQKTYAVMQWYAWPTGGSPDASRWFWADQWMQLRDRHRMPWVAVSLMMPIKPLGDIEPAQTTLEALGQQVQTTLIHDVFSDVSSEDG